MEVPALGERGGTSGSPASAPHIGASAIVLKETSGSSLREHIDTWIAARAARSRIVRVTVEAGRREVPLSGLTALVLRIGVVNPDLQPVTGRLLHRLASDRTATFARFVDLLELFELLAVDRDVVVAIDEAHHLDDASAALLRRLMRTTTTPWPRLLVGLQRHDTRFDHPLIPVQQVGGVTTADVVQALRQVGNLEPSPAVVAVLLAHVGDASSALTTVVGKLTPEQVVGWCRLPVPLPPLPASLAPDLSVLPDETRWALALVALSERDDTDVVGRALELAGSGWFELEPAEERHLVRLGDRHVRFPDSATRSHAAVGFTPAERRQLHAALARAIEERAPNSRADWARHLQAAGLVGNQALVGVWADVAVDAVAAGQPLEAARAMHEAVRHAPTAARRAELLVAAARHATDAGAVEWALRLLDEALPIAEDGVRGQVQHLHDQLRGSGGSPVAAMRAMMRRAEAIVDTDPAQGARVFTAASVAAMVAGQLEEGTRFARAAMQAAPRGTLDHDVAGLMASVLATASGAPPPLDRPLRAQLVSLAVGAGADAVIPRGLAPIALMWQGDLQGARVEFEELIDELERANHAGMMVLPLSGLAAVEVRRGHLDAALANARRSLEIGEQVGQSATTGTAHAVLAAIFAMRGDLDACKAQVWILRRLSSMTGSVPLAVYAGAAQGLLHLGLRHPQRAIVSLEEADVLAARQGVGEAAVTASAGDLLAAYLAVGRRDEAGKLLERLEEQAVGTANPWTLGIVHRGRALLGTDGDPDDNLDASVARFAALGMRFEEARTHLVAAARRVNVGHARDAARSIDMARMLLEPLGTRVWIERCDLLEDRLVGLRDRLGPSARLTEQERRVADLVVTGATNRSIAATMVLTQKTIEYHLHNIYRRLQLSSRQELIEFWRNRDVHDPPPG